MAAAVIFFCAGEAGWADGGGNGGSPGGTPLPGTTFVLQPGETFVYEPGETVDYHLAHAWPADVPYTAPPVYLRVDDGVATQQVEFHNAHDMVKQGGGTLRLKAGSISPHTHFLVSEGGLYLDSFDLFGGLITVGSGAWLGGISSLPYGVTAVTVKAGGRLEPGRAISSPDNNGTFAPAQLQLSDSLVLEDGSTLALRTWVGEQHDSVHVGACGVLAPSCAAQLGGRLLALPQGNPSDWENITQVTYKDVVKAEEGFAGSRFASVESALPWLMPSLHYSEDDMAVSLTLALAPVNEPDPKPDSQIDPPADDADEPPITQPDTPVSRARPVPSSWAGTVAGWLMEDSRFIRQAITQTGTRRSGLWAHGFHSQGERRASGPGNYQTSDVAGNHTGSLASHGAGTTRDISGVFVGLSADIHPQWRLGGVVGGSHSHIRGVLDSSRIETSHLGLYAHGEFQPAEVTLGAALAHHRIKNQRTAWAGQLAHGARFSHRAQTRQVFGRLALNAWGHQHARTHIQPFIETVWLQHKARAATETGGPLALAWHKQRHARGYTSLGLQAHHQLDLPGNTLATLSASLGWRQLHGKRHLHTSHHYRYDPLQSPFSGRHTPGSQAAKLPRQRWDISLGLDAQLGRHSQLRIAYTGSHGRRLQDHGVQLALAMAFD